jgi:hydroxyethylthiazole kinase-like uncharacterized protein yjeF
VNILTAAQMKAWDEFTMQHEPVASIELMERAAKKVVEWIEQQDWKDHTFRIFCGKGNNGGDGLAAARMLLQKNYNVFIYVVDNGKPGSADFESNLKKLQSLSFQVKNISTANEFPSISSEEIMVDALFGSGLNKPLENVYADLADHLNASGATIVSIDIPGGLFADKTSKGHKVIKADFTLTFQSYKTGLLMQENAPFIGDVHLLDIGLHKNFIPEGKTDRLIDEKLIAQIYQPRNRFAHKGNFGHALLIGGSFGKMGAVVLSATAAIRTGVGLLSCFIPRCGYTIMQTAVPEAMVMVDESETHIGQLPEAIEKYAAIGIGPGMGTADATQKMIAFIVRRYPKPLVLDADALNCLSLQRELLPLLPSCSILTPHPKEFDRMFGDHQNDFDRIETARKKAKELNIVIVLKGHHSFVATPEGDCYFNSTGNAGMAKGGSGDVLTGIITALVAQGYRPGQAAIFGVYMHGYAGDLAAEALSKESMTPSDLISFLPDSFLDLNK